MSMLIVFLAGVVALIADWKVNLQKAQEDAKCADFDSMWEEYDNPTCCKHCGGTMLGDGYSEVIHCGFAEWESYAHETPDSSPVYCGH